MRRPKGRIRLSWITVLWCVVLTAIGPGCARAERESAPVHFFFVQITDTHWGAGDSVSLTRTAAAMVNQLPVPIEFVVHTGDVLADRIGDAGIVAEGLEAMKAIKVPVYYIPGNHDILADDGDNTARLFGQYFGALKSRVEIKGVICLFVNTEPLKGDTGSPGQVQRKWVESQLREAGGRPVLIFMHRPPVQDLLAEGDASAWNRESYHPRWARLFIEQPEIKAVVAGHLHRDELHWIGSVPIYVASSLARFWDRQPSFRLYEYRDGKLGYWTIYLKRTPSKKNQP
ncbi:MAG: metallophosphoesterase [bacterium]